MRGAPRHRSRSILSKAWCRLFPCLAVAIFTIYCQCRKANKFLTAHSIFFYHGAWRSPLIWHRVSVSPVEEMEGLVASGRCLHAPARCRFPRVFGLRRHVLH